MKSTSTLINPTIGRIVWFTPAPIDGVGCNPEQPLAAIVVFVHSDRLVNLTVFDANGNCHARPNVALLQEDDAGNPQTQFCQWMPYQKNQAIKAEEAPAAPFDATPPVGADLAANPVDSTPLPETTVVSETVVPDVVTDAVVGDPSLIATTSTS